MILDIWRGSKYTSTHLHLHSTVPMVLKSKIINIEIRTQNVIQGHCYYFRPTPFPLLPVSLIYFRDEIKESNVQLYPAKQTLSVLLISS